MQIDHLSLTHFRNYARLELSLPSGKPILLYGENAQGKTSLLEAIYYLATAKSPYTVSDRQLIHWRAENDPVRVVIALAALDADQHVLALSQLMDALAAPEDMDSLLAARTREDIIRVLRREK